MWVWTGDHRSEEIMHTVTLFLPTHQASSLDPPITETLLYRVHLVISSLTTHIAAQALCTLLASRHPSLSAHLLSIMRRHNHHEAVSVIITPQAHKYKYSSLLHFTHAHTCSGMPTHAHACSHMLMHALWSHIPTHSPTLWHMPTPAHTCSDMLTHAHTCSHMLTHAHT